jgi:hypothetical protein
VFIASNFAFYIMQRAAAGHPVPAQSTDWLWLAAAAAPIPLLMTLTFVLPQPARHFSKQSSRVTSP